MKKYRILWKLFWTFVKISSVSVGGGLTMIPLIEKYFTPPHGDLTPEDIVDTVAFSQSMPGIIAVNMSGFIGMRLGGVAGAVAASFGVVIPSNSKCFSSPTSILASSFTVSLSAGISMGFCS
ncbi:MAG: chromate transporter, partial [Lentisphaeria bacterium]|nr:chromate transporter [Lentisphaeria bacterium]